MSSLSRVAVCAALTAVVSTGIAGPASAATAATDVDSRGAALTALHAQSKAPGTRAPQTVRQAQTLLMVAAPKSALAALARQAADGGADIRHRFDALGSFSLAVPQDRASAVAARLQASGARVTRIPTRSLLGEPDDSLYSHQSLYYGNVNAPAAWDLGHGSSSVKIAVVDSGVDVTHPDLAGKVVSAYNAVDGSSDVTDAVGHGTFVAGVAAAASNNAAGVAGAGYDSSLLAVKVADSAGLITVDDEVAGINWAASHGAKVINISLGSADYDATEAAAIAHAESLGVTVVAAAGNDNASAKSYPAALPGVLAVGATDAATGQKAAFSNYGDWVSVAAPGVSIYSTTPVAGSSDFPGNTGYGAGDGTSFSSPLVAGEVGLLAAASPGATATELRNAVVGSAHAISGAQLGAGLVDFAAAFSMLPPSSTPTLTAPAPSQVLNDGVTLTASSSAASVQFSVDGTPVGAPQPVVSGGASTTWSSWNVLNGAHEIEAADCNSYGCGVPATVPVTVTNTAPTLSAPADAANVSGVVSLATTTTAPAVRFALDGVALGAVVPTSDGTASASWSSYGTANGSHAVSVAGCSLAGVCGDPTGVTVTLGNAVPGVTAPTAGKVVSGATTLTATAPGGGLAFVIDGVKRGFDGAAPYSLAFNASSLADGTHKLLVTSCNTSGTSCAGPSSAEVSFTAKSLHPALVAATSPISPNNDKRDDVSNATLRLTDTESATWSVLTPTGAVFNGPHPLGTLAKGDHRFSWNGRSNGGTAATNGLVYTVQVVTSATVNGVALKGLTTRAVRVDTAAPSMSSVVGANAGFYPVVDGYRDTVALGVSTNERGTLSLRIINSNGTTVRTASLTTSGPGAYHFTWNGRTAAGTQLPAGTYRFSFVMTDQALNRRGTGNYAVGLSLKKLVAKSTTLLKNGNTAYSYGGSAACAGGDPSTSDYATGLWLGNACDPYYDGPQIAAAFYSFTLPAAIKYTGMRFDSYGYSFYAPSYVDGFVYNPAIDDFDQITPHSIGSNATWTPLVAPSVGHIGSGRVLKAGLFVEDDPSDAADYDIAAVRLIVNYQVLA